MSDLFIPVILGTARPGRRSAAVAAHVLETVKQRGVRTTLVDVADFEFTATHEEAIDLGMYSEIMTEADGVVIVAPEYNHGYPGELKLLLDSEATAYRRKPVGFVSVSSGLMGGARMIEQLRLVTLALRMIPVSPAVHVSQVGEALDTDGAFASDSLQRVLDDMLDEVAWYATALARH